MKKLIYVSHSIRGKAGNNATDEEMKQNNGRAIEFGNWLRQRFLDYNFYIPGELDGFLLPRGIKPIKIVEGLMALDFAIIDISVGMIMFMPDDYVSKALDWV